MSKILNPSSHPLLQRLWRNSQTVWLAATQGVTAVGLGGAAYMHDVLNDSEVKSILGQLTLPKWFPGVLLVLAVLTFIAHGHKDNNA